MEGMVSSTRYGYMVSRVQIQLDSMIWKVFSNLNDPVILWILYVLSWELLTA